MKDLESLTISTYFMNKTLYNLNSTGIVVVEYFYKYILSKYQHLLQYLS